MGGEDEGEGEGGVDEEGEEGEGESEGEEEEEERGWIGIKQTTTQTHKKEEREEKPHIPPNETGQDGDPDSSLGLLVLQATGRYLFRLLIRSLRNALKGAPSAAGGDVSITWGEVCTYVTFYHVHMLHVTDILFYLFLFLSKFNFKFKFDLIV